MEKFNEKGEKLRSHFSLNLKMLGWTVGPPLYQLVTLCRERERGKAPNQALFKNRVLFTCVLSAHVKMSKIKRNMGFSMGFSIQYRF